MKIYLTLFLGVLFASSIKVQAQQDPNFNMYRFNMNTINPAYAGSTPTTEVQLIHKNQWLGVDEAPSTQTLIYQRSLKGNIGLGATVNNDKIFVLQQTTVAIDMSYKLKLSSSTKLFFGIKPGVAFTGIDLSRVGLDGVSDDLFNRNESYIAPTFGVGLYLQAKNWYATVSTPNFVKADKLIREQGVPAAVTVRPHFYVGSGYHITINKDLKITPEFLVRAIQGAPNSYNLALNYEVFNKINAGINWRIQENIGFYGLFGVRDDLALGFGYDFTTTQIIQTNNNYSVEFLVKYKFL